MATKEQNIEFLNNATSTLNQIATNPSTPKNIRISLLDDVTQDPNLPSYVRTSLWQAVSTLESIRE